MLLKTNKNKCITDIILKKLWTTTSPIASLIIYNKGGANLSVFRVLLKVRMSFEARKVIDSRFQSGGVEMPKARFPLTLIVSPFTLNLKLNIVLICLILLIELGSVKKLAH